VAKMSHKDVSVLTGLQQSMQECADQERFPDYVRLNAQFHDFFAKKCGNKFSGNHLWRVEDGLVKNPGIEMVGAIAKALNVSVDAILK